MLELLWDTIRPMLSREDVKAARRAFDEAELALGAHSSGRDKNVGAA